MNDKAKVVRTQGARASTTDASGRSVASTTGGQLPRQLLIAMMVLACVVPLIYSLFTDHIWEDSFITLRHSEHLLQGKGLTFNPPELVHGFTSPVNVLMLAACSLVTGQSSYEATIWLYRIVSIIAFAGGIALLARRLWQDTPNHPLVCAGAFALLYAFELKMVTFTANGMETAFMLLAFAGALSLLVKDDPTPWLGRGLFWAAMMWTRPDGCIYIAGMGLADLLFSPGMRSKVFLSLVKSGLLCAVLYAPWIAWAGWYYGSPIPHTVTAKARVEVGGGEQMLLAFDSLFERFVTCANASFLPIYDWLGPNYFDNRLARWALQSITRFASLFCCFYWLFPVRDRLGRAASLTFAVAMLYFTPMVNPAPWYLAFATLPALVALPRGILTLSDLALRHRGKPVEGKLHPLATVALLLLVSGQIVLCGINAWEMRIQQIEIEMGNRYALGNWLHDHGREEDTVFLEPLGYIGYFSKMHMLDWPGLVTPQVVAIRRESPGGMLSMIPKLMPDWVVLRPREHQFLGSLREGFDEHYALAQVFDAHDRLAAYKFIPGKAYVYNDAEFWVFRRKDLRPTDFPSVGLPIPVRQE